jgi:hypothetical protein
LVADQSIGGWPLEKIFAAGLCVKQTVLGLRQVECRFPKNFSCTLLQAPSVTQVTSLHLFDGLLNLPPDPNSEHQAGNMNRLARAAGESCCLVTGH